MRLRRLLEWHQIIVGANFAAERENLGESEINSSPANP